MAHIEKQHTVLGRLFGNSSLTTTSAQATHAAAETHAHHDEACLGQRHDVDEAATLRAQLRAHNGNIQELAPHYQRQFYARQKSTGGAHFEAVKAQHNGNAGSSDLDTRSLTERAKDGLLVSWKAGNAPIRKALALDVQDQAKDTAVQLESLKQSRYDARLKTQDPARYARVQQLRAHDAVEMRKSIDPAEVAREKIRREEEQRSQSLLAQDKGAWQAKLRQSDPQKFKLLAQQEAAAMESIQADHLTETMDRADAASALYRSEKAVLTRDKASWLHSLPAAQRARFVTMEKLADANIIRSGTDARQAQRTVDNLISGGAAASIQTEGLPHGAADFVTMGGATASKEAGHHLGLARSYGDQAKQLEAMGKTGEAREFSGREDVSLLQGGVNLAMTAMTIRGAANLTRRVARSAGRSEAEAVEEGMIREETAAASGVANEEMAGAQGVARQELPAAARESGISACGPLGSPSGVSGTLRHLVDKHVRQPFYRGVGNAFWNVTKWRSKVFSPQQKWVHGCHFRPDAPAPGRSAWQNFLDLTGIKKFPRQNYEYLDNQGVTKLYGLEQKHVEQVFDALPADARRQMLGVTKEIHLTTLPEHIMGLADSKEGVIMLNRNFFLKPLQAGEVAPMSRTLIHEATHVLDMAKGTGRKFFTVTDKEAAKRMGSGFWENDYPSFYSQHCSQILRQPYEDTAELSASLFVLRQRLKDEGLPEGALYKIINQPSLVMQKHKFVAEKLWGLAPETIESEAAKSNLDVREFLNKMDRDYVAMARKYRTDLDYPKRLGLSDEDVRENLFAKYDLKL